MQGFAGLEQGYANYLGSNRLLRGSWPHGPPPSPKEKELNLNPKKNNVLAKIVNKVSQRSLRTNERSIWYGEDLYVSDVTAIYLSL